MYTIDHGLDFFEALTILFIVLKLIGIIEWSWWLVLGPIWIPIAVILGFILVVLFIYLLVFLIKVLYEIIDIIY